MGTSKVGYKNPPAHSRFQKGQSGNPRGRPKPQKLFARAYAELIKKRVAVNVDGKRQDKGFIEAVVLQLGISALKGDSRAIKTLLLLEADLKNDPTLRPYEDPEQVKVEGREFLRVMLEGQKKQERELRAIWDEEHAAELAALKAFKERNPG